MKFKKKTLVYANFLTYPYVMHMHMHMLNQSCQIQSICPMVYSPYISTLAAMMLHVISQPAFLGTPFWKILSIKTKTHKIILFLLILLLTFLYRPKMSDPKCLPPMHDALVLHLSGDVNY